MIARFLFTVSQPTSTPAPCAPPGVAAPADQTRWFASEVHVHDAQLKSYLRGSFPGVRDVDDVVQESYMRVWNTCSARPIHSAKAFLFTVARNIALKVLRKDSNAPFVPLEEEAAVRIPDDKPDAAVTAGVQEKIDLLADAVMTLPPRCRDIVILCRLQGFSQKEVAARLRLSERTVESQVRIGVKRCLAFLRRHGVESAYNDET